MQGSGSVPLVTPSVPLALPRPGGGCCSFVLEPKRWQFEQLLEKARQSGPAVKRGPAARSRPPQPDGPDLGGRVGVVGSGGWDCGRPGRGRPATTPRGAVRVTIAK